MPKRTNEPVFDDDNPEWTADDFARAVRFPDGVRLKDLKPEDLDRILRKPNPPAANEDDE